MRLTCLKDRYDAENALTPKIAVPDVMRLLVMSGALAFAGRHACSDAPVHQRPGVSRLRRAGQACDAVYVWRLVEGAVPVLPSQLAPVLYDGNSDEPDGSWLYARPSIDKRMIMPVGDGYSVAAEQITCLIQTRGITHGCRRPGACADAGRRADDYR